MLKRGDLGFGLNRRNIGVMPSIHMKNVKRLGKLSTELYNKIFSFIKITSCHGFKNRMIHLADAVDCGNITPLEAYDALKQFEIIGYLPVLIDSRKSNYSHIL